MVRVEQFRNLAGRPPGKYMEYYINEEVAHEEGRMIRSLCPYDGRHLLVGTMEGIYLFDTARKNYRTFHSGFSHLYCTDIKRDPHGAFWCSTRQGLYKIQGNRVERADPTLLPGLPSETVRFSLPPFRWQHLGLYGFERPVSLSAGKRTSPTTQ